MGQIRLPPDFCPINDDLLEGWYCPVTILPEDYFKRRIKKKEPVELNLFNDPLDT